MLDWPLQTQTSPTSTSLITRSPILSSCGPPAGRGSSFSDHLPSAPALADFFCPAISTASSAPGAAVPQTGQARSRCSTIPSVNSVESFVSAEGVADTRSAMSRAARRIESLLKPGYLTHFDVQNLHQTWRRNPLSAHQARRASTDFFPLARVILEDDAGGLAVA